MREVIRHHAINIGADQIKLSMSGEEVCTQLRFLTPMILTLLRSQKFVLLKTAIFPTRRQLLVSTKLTSWAVACAPTLVLEIPLKCAFVMVLM
jgi:hypothetical protein